MQKNHLSYAPFIQKNDICHNDCFHGLLIMHVLNHKIEIMNIETFRSDFLVRLSETCISQNQLSARYGVQQAALSRFSSRKSGLSFESVLKLWPFVYNCNFPSTSTPATLPAAASPEETADAAAPVPRRRGRPRRHSEGTPAAGAGAGGGGSGAPECGAGAA